MKKIMDCLGYIKDEMLSFPPYEDDAGIWPWFISIASLAFMFLLVALLGLLARLSEALACTLAILAAPLWVILILRGSAGVIISFVPFVKSFFPYTVKAVDCLFYSMEDGHFGPVVVYWGKKFLTRKTAERFVEDTHGLTLKEVKGRVFYAWGGSGD